jgi:hypothetical protein
MRRELNLFIWGTLALILGNLGTLAIPYYIGLFIDDMTRGNYDNIQSLVYELLIIIFVSTFLISKLILDILCRRLLKRDALQLSE